MRKELSVKLLPADLFASMAGILGNKIYESTVKVIRVPGSPSVMRQQVVAAKLFRLSKAEKIAAQKVMQHRNRNRVSARKDGNWTTHAQDD